MLVRSPRPPRLRFVGASSFAVSLTAHAVLLGFGAFLLSVDWQQTAAKALPSPRSDEIAVDVAAIHLPALNVGPPLGEPSPDEPLFTDRVDPGGGEGVPRPDSDRRGHGGAVRVDSPAVNLADRDEGLTLSREVTSRVDRDQVQRLATSNHRASLEDRRSTTQPMDLVFLATGSGHLAERRPFAAVDPNRGAIDAPQAGVRGSVAGSPQRDQGDLDAARVPGGEVGGDRASPGAGILGARPGPDHHVAAAVAMGRPRVTQGAPSVPADHAGRPRDTVDSEQEVAVTVQSLVHASTPGGKPDAGPGGEDGAATVGSGGVAGPGSRAAPLGGGAGPFTGISDADPRISAYRRRVLAKIYPLWENAFPKSASLAGRQGRAIISLIIYADGHVDQVAVARASGVPEFDENVRIAVLRAAPFDPFPPSIPGPSMRWKIEFDMNNPAVR